jgi:predicted transcriptional regulator
VAIIPEENYLAHYGILRRSGRYPWGSGEDPGQRGRDFLGTVADLRSKGLSDGEIAKGMSLYTEDGNPWSTTEFRNAVTIARNAKKAADISMAQRLKEHGYSNVKIGEKMGIPESSVRALLAPSAKARADVLESTSSFLKDQVEKKGYLDVGTGTEHYMNISDTKLRAAISRLTKEEDYKLFYVKVPQLGTKHETTMKVLVKPRTEYSEVFRNRDQIQSVAGYSNDGGKTFLAIKPPLSINSSRVGVRYKEEGGADADGVVYVRPGVDDLSMGKSRYAQVRIAVDGSHYIKGMAMYKDDLPDGVDLLFNTNKSNTGNKHDALKPLQKTKDGKVDNDNPFGAVIRRQITTPDGKKVTSVMNMVNEEGSWDQWSRSLSSQFLSKQSPTLAKTQLDMASDRKRRELDEIMNLNNPAVKKRLLESYADDADSSAVHLKAAALPRQANKVILPVNSLKETEVYAPTFKNGERVVLVRFPHGGTFEIPELTVNNRHPQAKKLLKDATDAIGINSKVAERLSGADFDGDTVLVIPNNHGKVKSSPALKGLENFDTKSRYPEYPGMKRMTPREKGMQMGVVSNLITDMTIGGANADELARAVRHSMVVIDAEKHKLNWRQSAKDNGIPALMEKYQGKKTGGAATLISKAGRKIDVRERKQGYKVDPVTGKKIYTETGATYVDPVSGKTVFRIDRGKKLLGEVDDAFQLVSPHKTRVETIYAEHSNRLKGMANEARKSMVAIKNTPYSPSARTAYAKEVTALNSKLTAALRNAPLERQAQVLANALYKAKKAEYPDMEKSEEKKIKFLALKTARLRVGAGKDDFDITDAEWDAIQAGAISNHKLNQILTHANIERIKELATPRSITTVSSSTMARARSMANQGYSQGEIAEQLGVAVSTLQKSLGEEE